MEHKIIFLFPGQGGQYLKMGAQLYHSNKAFAICLEECDAIYHQYLGYSLIDQLYEHPKNNLDDLLFSTPAILSLEVSMLAALNSLGISANYVVGNSIGEFAAAIASGIWTKEVALEIIIEHSKSMVQSNLEGGMLTVMNLSYEDLAPLLSKYQLYIASFNCPNNYTLSGNKDNLDALQKELAIKGLLFYRLPIAYPFHSPLIESAKIGYDYYMSTNPLPFAPKDEFISGIFCKRLTTLPLDYFWKVVSEPMNVPKLVNYLEEKAPCLYIDLGPSGTLATFVKYNLSSTSQSITHPIMTPFKTELKQLDLLVKMIKGNKQ